MMQGVTNQRSKGERLETDCVQLGSQAFANKEHQEISTGFFFESVAKRSRVIRRHIKAHGQWPKKFDIRKMVNQVKLSFILSSAIFKCIVQSVNPDDLLTTSICQ